VRNADEFTRKYMLSYIQSIERQHGDDLVSLTRRVIGDIVSSGRCNKTLIAGYMAMEPRTLQRRLAAQGYSFRQLIEEVRGAMVLQLIADSQKSFSEIAEMVGYSELSAFSRFFQRIYGKSPSEWRIENSLHK
jgi:AraC-like DNA-binding protein